MALSRAISSRVMGGHWFTLVSVSIQRTSGGDDGSRDATKSLDETDEFLHTDRVEHLFMVNVGLV